MKIQRFLTIIASIFAFSSISAQSLSVGAFNLLEGDKTASTTNVVKYGFGKDVHPAPLIKVVIPDIENWYHNAAERTMLLVSQERKEGEIWLYVEENERRIVLWNPTTKERFNYVSPMTLENGNTYELVLKTNDNTDDQTQIPDKQNVIFKIEPKDAIISIDGKEAQSLDENGILSLKLKKGKHNYKVTSKNHISAYGIFEVEKDILIRDFALRPLKAKLTVVTDPDADIYINGEYKRFGSWNGDVNAGNNVVESRKTSYRSAKMEISLEPEEEQRIEIRPEPIYGSLEINSTPSGSDVYIDGRLKDKTPYSLNNILIGKHKIKIVNPGYEDKEIEINIEEGQLLSKTIALQEIDVTKQNAKKENIHQNHEFVDMGLSVKWATCNVGADKPEDSGDYYAWGEIEPHYIKDSQSGKMSWKAGLEGYSSEKYKYCKDGFLTKYVKSDNKVILDPEDDVAHVQWGGNWRMPTQKEFEELLNTANCTWYYITQDGVKGYKVWSNKTGNSIFLPTAGFMVGTYIMDSYHGQYWSVTLDQDDRRNACFLSISDESDWAHRCEYGSRYNGLSIRPVCP